jgi:serine protease Do
LNRDIAETYDIPHEKGVLVLKVGRGSPAHRGGMSSGDVIFEADSKPLKGWEDLQHVIQGKKVGERLELSVGRERDRGKIDVVLEEAPN